MLVLLLACSGSTATDTSAADTSATTETGLGDTADTAADTGDTDTSGLRTFDNCGGSVAADVPEFYQRYFKCADVSMDGTDVLLGTKNLPPYTSPYYPSSDPNHVAWDDRGGDYHQNPNDLAEQALMFRISDKPVAKGLTITTAMVDLEMGTSTDEYPGGPAGLGLDGIAYFNAVAGRGDSILDEAYTFDLWEAHPEMTGVYHHHSQSPGPLAALVAGGYVSTSVVGAAEWELYGILCDGTVLLGCNELDGGAVDPGTLDAQDGHVGDLAGDDGTVFFTGRYHVHMCADYAHYGLTPEIQYYDTCGTLGR